MNDPSDYADLIEEFRRDRVRRDEIRKLVTRGWNAPAHLKVDYFVATGNWTALVEMGKEVAPAMLKYVKDVEWPPPISQSPSGNR